MTDVTDVNPTPTATARTAAWQPVVPIETPLVLTAPAPVAQVAATSAPTTAPTVDAAALPALDTMVTDFLTTLLAADPRSPEFAASVRDARVMGDADIRNAAACTGRLADSPARALAAGGLAPGSAVGTTLAELRRIITQLDPSGAGSARTLRGLLHAGDRTADYFRTYQHAQGRLDAILHALRSAQDELQKDNAALTLEKAELWTAMARLTQYVYVVERLDARLTARIAELEPTDPDRATALRDDVLLAVRQKHQDLLVQLAVSSQGYLAIDVVIRSNLELVTGVDRASTTTVAALRTAIVVAQAISNQRLVLDQIAELTTTTTSIIEQPSRPHADGPAQADDQPATAGLPQLHAAFANVYATMDAIDEFTTTARGTLSTTIGSLAAEVGTARDHLDRGRPHDEPSTHDPLGPAGTGGGR